MREYKPYQGYAGVVPEGGVLGQGWRGRIGWFLGCLMIAQHGLPILGIKVQYHYHPYERIQATPIPKATQGWSGEEACLGWRGRIR